MGNEPEVGRAKHDAPTGVVWRWRASSWEPRRMAAASVCFCLDVFARVKPEAGFRCEYIEWHRPVCKVMICPPFPYMHGELMEIKIKMVRMVKIKMLQLRK